MLRRLPTWTLVSLLCLAQFTSLGWAQDTRWDELMQAGKAVLEAKQYKQAENYYKEALAEASTGDPHDPKVIDSLQALATLQHAQGKLLAEEPFLRRILELREDKLGPADPEVVPAILGLAWLYESLHKLVEAEPLIRRALEIQESHLGPTHSETIHRVNELASICMGLHKYGEAEELFLRSLRAHQEMQPPEVTALVHDLENLSAVYMMLGRNAEAEALSRQALEMQEPGSNALTGDVARKLGAFYWAQGRFAEAEPLLLSWLESQEKIYGADHPNVQMCLSDLSNFYRVQDRDPEAVAMEKRALAIAQKTSANAPGGETDPQAWMSLVNSAAVFMGHGEFARAEELYGRALALMKKTDHPDYPSKASTLGGLGTALCWQGKYEESMAVFKQSIEIAEKAVGRDNPQAAEGQMSVARCLIWSGQDQEAETLFQQLIQKFDKPGKLAPPILLRVLSEYSRLLRSLNKESEAERVKARLEELLNEMRRDRLSPP